MLLSKEKQRAIIEAMLFVSTQPVSIGKMLKRLKKANRMEEKALGIEGEEEVLEDSDENVLEQQVEAADHVEALEIDGIEEGLTDPFDVSAEISVNEAVIQGGALVVGEDEEDVYYVSDEDDVDVVAESEEETDEIDISSLVMNAAAENDNAILDVEDETLDALDSDQIEEEVQVEQALEGGAQEDEFEQLDDEGDDDVMAQLLSKQKELDSDLSAADIKTILNEIQEAYAQEHSGMELVQVAKGYQFRTKYDVSMYLRDEKVKAPSRFSPSSLETLAIVAYQQPITRNKVEEIRGVDSGGVIKTLLDKGILKVVGRSDEPGKPLIYGTSVKFLEVFGLKNLRDLPSLSDYNSLNSAQKEDEFKEQQQGIVVDDLIESDFDQLTEAEQAVLGDLDESLQDLKKVEKEVMTAADPQLEETDAHEGDIVEASAEESAVIDEEIEPAVSMNDDEGDEHPTGV